jgi:hypothetical protein
MGLMPIRKSSKLDWCDLFGEPEGWSELQARARSEHDARKLKAIIAEMNRLLGECEKKANGNQAPRPALRRGSAKWTSIDE